MLPLPTNPKIAGYGCFEDKRDQLNPACSLKLKIAANCCCILSADALNLDAQRTQYQLLNCLSFIETKSCATVNESPELNKMIVLSKGISVQLKTATPAGGKTQPMNALVFKLT